MGGAIDPTDPTESPDSTSFWKWIGKNQTQTPYFFLSRSLNLIGGPNVELFEAKA